MRTTVRPPLTFDVLGSDLGYLEGPVVAGDGTVHVADLSEGRIWRLNGGDPTVVARVDGAPNGLAHRSPTTLLVANNGGFPWTDVAGVRQPVDLVRQTNEPLGFVNGWMEQIDLTTGAVTRLIEHVDGRPLRGPNDLVVDDVGGVWFTDTGKYRSDDVDYSTLYYLAPDGRSAVARARQLLGANGVGLSPDGERLYVSETLSGRLWAWDLDGPGVLRRASGSDPFHGGTCIAATAYLLDSLAIEADGRIVIAAPLVGLIVITPDGSELDVHPIAGDSTTNIAFGGPDRRRAVITLARSGRVVETTWPRPGLALGG